MTNTQTSGTDFPVTLSVTDVAHILDVVPATVYQWIRNNDLPNLRLGGRVRIPTAKLATMLGVDPVHLTRQVKGRERRTKHTDSERH